MYYKSCNNRRLVGWGVVGARVPMVKSLAEVWAQVMEQWVKEEGGLLDLLQSWPCLLDEWRTFRFASCQTSGLEPSSCAKWRMFCISNICDKKKIGYINWYNATRLGQLSRNWCWKKKSFHFSCSLVKYATVDRNAVSYECNYFYCWIAFLLWKISIPSQVNLISFLLGIFYVEHFFNVILYMFQRPTWPSLDKINISGGFPLCYICYSSFCEEGFKAFSGRTMMCQPCDLLYIYVFISI